MRRARQGEAGYTLMLALFIAATMIIAASVAVPNLITQNRRQREKLMIWRGRQYARAIGLYYRKTGHFPHDLRELNHGVNDLHFLRQPYKNPMSADGTWRLVYLGAGGQLTGSLCWRTLAEYQAAEMGVAMAVPTRNPATAFGSSAPKAPVVPTCAMYGENASSSFHPRIISEGDMIGGNLIGVGGETDKASIKHYMGADKYRYWEFIWSPNKGTRIALPGQSKPNAKGTSAGSGSYGQPGSSPTSAPPTSSAPPGGNGQTPPSGMFQQP